MAKKPDQAGTNVTAALDFIGALFGDDRTTSSVYFSSLANNDADPSEKGERRLVTRDAERLIEFLQAWNKPGRGMFFAVGTVTERRTKDGIVETIGLHADIDFKGVEYGNVEEIYAAIARLKCKPTVIVNSGHGVHLYWLFNQSIAAQEHRDRIEELLRLVCDVVAGDPQVCEISRLMRLPGTHNTKFSSWVSVECVQLDGPRYELRDLEAWLGTKSKPLQKPVLQRRVGGVIGADAPTSSDDNPFTRQAHAQGYHPPIDVEVRLAMMVFGGAGDTGVNATQRDVTASLISRGETVDSVTDRVMTATQALAGTDGWDWRKERRKIHNLCLSWLNKKPEILQKQEQRQEEAAAAGDGMQEGATVHDLGAAREKKQQQEEDNAKANRKAPKRSDAPYIIAEAIPDILRLGGEDIMHTEGETWLYQFGFWRLMTPADEQRLRSLIQTGFDELQLKAKAADLNNAWVRLMQHPELTKQNVPWAGAGKLVCTNGVLDLVTGSFDEHSPTTYARQHIGTAFTPGEKCPIFEAFLSSLFSRHAEAPALVQLIQEWGGSALAISSMVREQRRALVLVGPSRTGKTELAKIFSRLFGDPIASPSVAEIGSKNKFGLQDLYGAVAWVRDDAINEGDALDPQRYKTIITGEGVNVAIKGKPSIFGHRFNIPVLLTCNSLPRARDGSDAIFNRSLVVPMTTIVSEHDVRTARIAVLGVRANDKGSLGDVIFEAEASGILNFMLIGLVRLRRRGYYEITKAVADALQSFKDENNPVSAWSRDAIQVAPQGRVERRDLVRCYNGWEHDLEGEEAIARGGRWVIPKLRTLIPGLGEIQAHGGRRYIIGLQLTELGLAAWESYAKATPKPGGHATSVDRVNEIHMEGEPDAGEPKF